VQPNKRYTYEDAGFNVLMNRSKKSVMGTGGLKGSSKGSGRSLNFDLQQVEGSLGDNLRIGHINMKGSKSQIAIEDENGVELTWVGRLVAD